MLYPIRLNINLEIIPEIQASRLYCLEPYGLGTADVIAFTEYMICLAFEHSVKTGKLIGAEVIPTLNALRAVVHRLQLKSTKLETHPYSVLNGLSRQTEEWVDVLMVLTKRIDLRHTTMLMWRNVLPKLNLLSVDKVWCPDCYQDSHDNGRIFYDPLLWKLNPVTVCRHHPCKLLRICPFPDCHRPLSQLGPRNIPGYCEHCNRWLGRASLEAIGSADVLSPQEYEQASHINDLLGDLITRSVTLTEPPTTDTLFNALTRILDTVFKGQVSAFSRCANLSYGGLKRMFRDRRLSSLADMLKVCTSLNLLLFDLLTDTIPDDTLHHLSTVCTKYTVVRTRVIPQGRAAEKVRGKALETAIQAELVNCPPSPLAQVAAKLGWSEEGLQDYFPVWCAVIVQRFSAYKAEQKEILKQAFEVILARNTVPPPYLKYIAAELKTKPAQLRYFFPDLCDIVLGRQAQFKQQQDAQLKTILVEKLIEFPPPSLRQVARELSRDITSLGSLFPDVCKEISRRFLEYRHLLGIQHDQLKIQMIKDTVYKFHNLGHYPSSTLVFEALKGYVNRRYPPYHIAWKQALMELGYDLP